VRYFNIVKKSRGGKGRQKLFQTRMENKAIRGGFRTHLAAEEKARKCKKIHVTESKKRGKPLSVQGPKNNEERGVQELGDFPLKREE